MSGKLVILTTRTLTTDELKVLNTHYNLIEYNHDTMVNKQIMSNPAYDLVIIDIREQSNRDYWGYYHDTQPKTNLILLKSPTDRIDTEALGVKFICKRINTDATNKNELEYSLKVVTLPKRKNAFQRFLSSLLCCLAKSVN